IFILRNQHNLAIGARFDDRMVRLCRVGQREFLADNRPQGTRGEPGNEGGMHADELSLGGISQSNAQYRGVATHNGAPVTSRWPLIARATVANGGDPATAG